MVEGKVASPVDAPLFIPGIKGVGNLQSQVDIHPFDSFPGRNATG